MSYSGPRIGYVPYSQNLSKPGDRRRFAYYADKRGIQFEIADPEKDYDLVVLSSIADISVWRHYPNAKLVYDLIDSYLAIPRTSLKGQLRGLFKFLSRQSRYLQLNHWDAIGAMCKRADAVICSTAEQRSDISKFCSNVHIILDTHTGVARKVKVDYRAAPPFRLVWEGLPQTLGSLKMIRSVVERLRDQYPIEMHIVTDRECRRYLGQYGRADTIETARRIFPDVFFHEWKEADCADIICSCDLAVIPLDLGDPFAAGKPENKLLLFWRMGMPVVTSGSPAYTRAMEQAGIDLIAANPSDWLEKIEFLLRSEHARREAGNLGKMYVEQEFSDEKILARWDAVFSSIGIPFGGAS